MQQSPSASDLASVTSDRNSIRFQHVDNGEDWSDSSNESVNSNNHDLEVMDLRTGRSYPREVARMDAASIISISSNLSVDSETASRMYQVATAGDDGSDMPGHWEAMQAYPADATFTLHEGVGSVHETENPLGESEQAYLALMRLMRNEGCEGASSDVDSRNDGSEHDSERSGFW